MNLELNQGCNCSWGILRFCNKCGPPMMRKLRQVRPPPGPCAASSAVTHTCIHTYIYVCTCVYIYLFPRVSLIAEDALHTVLNAGLHHSWRLQRGGCNPILSGRAVVQPVKRKRALLCALTLSPVHSSPFYRVSPSSSLIWSLPALLGWSAAHNPPGSSHRIVHSVDLAPSSSPVKSTWYGGAFSPLFSNASTVGIYCTHASPVTCPSMFTSETASDLPESTLPSHCRSDLPTTHTHLDFTDCHWGGKRKTPDYKNGVLRHFKDDFLQSE